MYGTVADVQAGFEASQWDPATDAPDTATVTAWLTDQSTVLDGEIGHVVDVPVGSGASPNLYAVVEKIVVARVQADVYDQLYPPDSTPAAARRSSIWRAEANRLCDGIKRGATADGVSLGGRTPEAPGAPVYDFGDGANVFSRDQKF
jgi:hypothetical protein